MPLSQSDFANDGDSPLLVAIKAQRWDEASKHLGLVPQPASAAAGGDADGDGGEQDMVKIPDEYGNLPLHAAIGFKAPDTFLLKLIDANPSASEVHGSDDWTPLHIAAMYGCSLKVMKALILANPKALDDDGSYSNSNTDKDGSGTSSGSGSGIKRKTPRHYAGRHSPEIKELLLRPTDEWMKLIGEQEAQEQQSQ
mmetsp:Transcript_10197/g.24517  ORF Transcript_10197/g.24517 Transcript_10197/m.24517 type:complete len:196 (-) Transcript_10197:258-845(-)